jgi:hypothetical protein
MGAGGGAMTKTGHAVAFGRLAASTKPMSKPMNEKDLLVGLALEGRGEQSVGARFTMGAYAGWATPPECIFGFAAGEFHLEGGTPLDGALFGGDWYLGAGAAFPFPIQKRRMVSDINQSTWVLKRRFDLVPFLRILDHWDDGNDFAQRLEFSGGLAIRYRVVSDLF